MKLVSFYFLPAATFTLLSSLKSIKMITGFVSSSSLSPLPSLSLPISFHKHSTHLNLGPTLRHFASSSSSSSSSSFCLQSTPSSSSSTIPQTNPITINPLVADVKVSATVQIFSNVKQMQSQGIQVTSLCVGEPDFPPPTVVLEAASRAILGGDTRYTAVTGTASLRKAIAKDLKERKGLDYDFEKEIVVGNGAKQCVYQGILATVGVGDAVIVPAPYWPSYPEMVALAGAETIVLPTKESDGYLLTADELEKCLEDNRDKNVKLLILCNPSNPTGGVHDKERLEELAKVLVKYPQVAILADEIYERLVYDEEHVSFASISPEMFQRTMTVNGFSKAYAMTGMRLGYMAAPQPLAKAVTTIQSQLTSCAGSVSQAAGVAALNDVTEEEMTRNVEIMKSKRDYVIERLNQMDGVTLKVPPKGAFYVLPDVSSYYNGDDTQLCLDLLETKRLALVPGSSFGAPGTVRISYATSMEELQVAMDKLEEFLKDQ